MKILHLTHSFLPVPGGTTTRTYNLLKNTDFEYYIYVPLPPSRYVPSRFAFLPECEIIENFNIRRVKLEETKGFYYLTKVKKNGSILFNKIEKEKFDIVHGHNPIEFGFAALKYAKAHNIPFIYEIHTILCDTIFTSWSKIPKLMLNLAHSYYKRIEKILVANANKVIVQTDAIKTRVIGLFNIHPSKVVVIPNGVDLEIFNPKDYKEERVNFRKKGEWGDEKVLLYAGFLDEINGVDFLLRCLKNFPRELKKKTKMVFVGRGPLEPYVKEISEEEGWISFYGYVPYSEIKKYYASCDLFLIPQSSNPTTDNTIPLKLLEASAMGTYVLASDIPAIKTFSDGLDNIILFKKGNTDDFISKISQFVSGEIKIKLNLNSLKKIPNWEDSRAKLIKLYQMLNKSKF